MMLHVHNLCYRVSTYVRDVNTRMRQSYEVRYILKLCSTYCPTFKPSLVNQTAFLGVALID